MRKRLAAVFLTALVLRAGYALWAPPRPPDADDTAQWNNVARHFLRGEGWLTRTEDLDPKRAPLYPLFLAGNYLLFGDGNALAVRLSQALLGALACAIVGILGFLLVGPAAGFWAGLACALYPPLIVYCGILQSETLFTLLLMAFCLLLTLALQGRRLRWGAAAGLLLGLLNLCRGTLFYFPFFLLIALALIPSERKNIGKALVMAAVGFLVLAPWAWRNHRVYGGWLPTSAGGSEMLWFGTLPWSEQRLFGNAPSYRQFRDLKDPVAAEKAFSRAALDNVLRDPPRYLGLTLRKFLFFCFQPVGARLAAQKSRALAILAFAAQFLLIVTCVFGILRSRGAWKDFLALHLIILYFMLLHSILAPEPRYRLPVEPLFIFFAALGLLSLKAPAADERAS